jgi:hypothetical protein
VTAPNGVAAIGGIAAIGGVAAIGEVAAIGAGSLRSAPGPPRSGGGPGARKRYRVWAGSRRRFDSSGVGTP